MYYPYCSQIPFWDDVLLIPMLRIDINLMDIESIELYVKLFRN